MLQLAIFSLYLSRARQHPHSAATVGQHVADMLIAAAPTGIPTVIISSLFRGVHAMKKHGIAVHSTPKIKTAAAVEVVVLDKTGTLTGSVVGCQIMLCMHTRMYTMHCAGASCPTPPTHLTFLVVIGRLLA